MEIWKVFSLGRGGFFRFVHGQREPATKSEMGKIEGIGHYLTFITFVICFQCTRTPQGGIEIEAPNTESSRYTAIIGLRLF